MARPALLRNASSQALTPVSAGAPSVHEPVAPGAALGRDATVVAFEQAVVAFCVDVAEPLGIPRSVASIYGIVFASPSPLSFSDIAERLDISKGSISQGLRVLREVGAIKEVSTKANRSELFVPDIEMRKLIERFLESRVQRQLASGGDRLADLKRRVASFPAPHQASLQGRVRKLEQWHARARALIPLVRTFLKLGS